MQFDVIVIGGGPSGLMASIGAGEQGAKVLLIDKGEKLGRKLAISGGGRCNVTNRLPIDEIIKHIPGNGRFLFSAFSEFSNEDIIAFFEKLGVGLKEEDHGRMFPISDDAGSVVQALLTRLKELNVKTFTNSPVQTIDFEPEGIHTVHLKDGQVFTAKSVIIAVGGKSVPHTGSTGDGYAWAKKAGHTITDLFPTEVPLLSNERFIQSKTLQGLSLRDISLSVLNPKGKPLVTHRMDMIFTHFGISGPAVLRCSGFVVQAMKKWKLQEVTMKLDAIPDQKNEELFQHIIKTVKEEPKRAIKNSLKGLVPERYLQFLMEKAGLDGSEQGASISNEKLRNFVSLCKEFTFTVSGSQPIEKAFVTGGGVSVKEIHPKEMSSKIMDGLFFCGEVLDIHGYTGGYNITSALVTGRLAGVNAAKHSLQSKY
ncbi:NAD(P)/FAD-dependent oxidoreductase [Peribacillus alkalitolerans]|uniref:NAD(P)/FAD-dependent oxidoreductase n=1 Tax=Peribacillus alkalitolerans TaxID=1550385 RepID=UPI0013D4B9AE|nr:NAD(P)/FAD-dependent oxidoreductase [Peribacillus alkalitolerans]